MVLAKSVFIFLNERSFFTFFAPLTAWITSPLCYFCLARRDTRSLKNRALACSLFEIVIQVIQVIQNYQTLFTNVNVKLILISVF